MTMPAWARSVRLRLAVLYSVLVFGVAVIVVGVVNVGLSRTLSGDPVAEEYQITSFVNTPRGVVAVGETIIRRELREVEELVNQRTLDNLRTYSFVTLGALFPLSILIGWLVAGRALRPIDEITDVAREIQSTDLSRRIELEGPHDELRKLADTFDAMLDRVEQGINDQRAFVEDASHELRNPLAIMATNLDVALADEDADATSLRQTAEVVRRTVDRTTRTVDDLVTYARREVPEHRLVTLDVVALAAETVEEYMPPAGARGISIVTTGLDRLVIDADRDALKRALSNLLGNAVRLAPGGSQITVAVGEMGGWAWFGVRDQGPGIADEDHDLVFQRSWTASGRGSPAGRGLGLAIVRQVATSHGGRATLTSQLGTGSSFVVWLPKDRTGPRIQVTADRIHPIADPFATLGSA